MRNIFEIDNHLMIIDDDNPRRSSRLSADRESHDLVEAVLNIFRFDPVTIRSSLGISRLAGTVQTCDVVLDMILY